MTRAPPLSDADLIRLLAHALRLAQADLEAAGMSYPPQGAVNKALRQYTLWETHNAER